MHVTTHPKTFYDINGISSEKFELILAAASFFANIDPLHLEEDSRKIFLEEFCAAFEFDINKGALSTYYDTTEALSELFKELIEGYVGE